MVETLLLKEGIKSGPVPVAILAKSLGAEVHYQSAKDDLSGFLLRDRETKHAIIGVNANHAPTRKNFTAAHELGHFMLHDFDDVHVDRHSKVWLRDQTSSQGISIEEMEANLFAAELLMPAKFLEKDIERHRTLDLTDENVISELADTYKVSPQAMAIRLSYLGYIHH
jgi:Zn-dependent peptidase ImmA (M78 family)